MLHHSSRTLLIHASSLTLFAASMLTTGCSGGERDARASNALATGAGELAPMAAGAPGISVNAAVPGVGGGFVRVVGTHFELDSTPFYFQGTNVARFASGERESESQVYEAMRGYAQRGLRVVRVWGFSCRGYFGGEPIVASAYGGNIVYNEDAWRRLDATIDAARAAGIKVILPLVNYEPNYCGMQFWTSDVIGSNDRQTFYTDNRVKRAFKQYASDLLSRTNTRYQSALGQNIRYSDDPTIMAIEIANEPHTEDNYENARGLPPGELVYHFLGEMSDYVRSRDANHLISSGEEGYKVSTDAVLDTYDSGWINNGLKGVNFEKDVTLGNIDFATVHVYPDNWEIPSWKMDWVRQHIVQRRANIAHAAGKPIVMEESGFSDDASWHGYLGYSSNPTYWLGQIYSYANTADYAGTMIWELVPPASGHVSYDYTFNDPMASVVETQATYMWNRSGGTPPPAPPAPTGDAYPTCSAGATLDPNGDGWGWDHGQSCRVQTEFPACSSAAVRDAQGDGWGWENNRSCRFGGQVPVCSGGAVRDAQGDGWGWENNRSCRFSG